MTDFLSGLLDAIGDVVTSIGTGTLLTLGLIMLVLGVISVLLEVVLRRTPRFRPRPGLVPNGVTWSPRELLVTAMCAAIYSVTLAVTAGIQLIPGFVQARPANALIAVFAVLFGIPGVTGLALGNILGDIFSGTLTLGSVGGCIGIFMAGYLVHVIVRGRNPSGGGAIARFYLATFLSALAGAGLLISAWLAVVRILPPEAVWTAAFSSIFFVVLYPQWLFSLLLLKALYPAFERRGWIGADDDSDDDDGGRGGGDRPSTARQA